jgi:hypothetical protein
MAVIILEHRNSFTNTRQIIIVALIPAFFGGLMEVMQQDLQHPGKLMS